MRILKLLLPVFLLTVLALCSCSPEDPFVPTKSADTIAHPAFVRVIQASEEARNVVVQMGGKNFFSAPIQYLYSDANNTFEYYPADTSWKSVSFLGGGNILASSPVTLKQGQYYTAYLYGTTGAYHVLITRDTVTPPPSAALCIVRIVHLSPDSPNLNVRIGDNPVTAPIVVSNLAYGSGSAYFTQPQRIPGTGMGIEDATTGKMLFAIPKGYALFPGQSIITMVMTGRIHPTGDQRFITLTAFQESTPNADGSFGGSGFALSLAGVRFANLVATKPNGLGVDQTLDLAVRDPAVKDWAVNDYFRRNFSGLLENVAPLGFSPTLGLKPINPLYLFFLPYISKLTYRVEINSAGGNSYIASKQDTLIGRSTFQPDTGRRYTIVAFGAFKKDSARTTIVKDNAPAPSSSAMMRVRLFNGAFNLPDSKLRIRIGGVTSPAMPYGKAPDGSTESFEAPVESAIDLLDESGQVIANATAPDGLFYGGGVFTIYLSRGAYGTSYVLTPVDDGFSL